MVIKVKPEELLTLEDGYVYYAPSPNNGVFGAETLREIADQLDALNADWDKQVIEELSNKPDKFFYNNKKLGE